MVTAKILWATAVVVAHVLLLRGAWAQLYFEPTGEALAEAAHGRLLITIGSLVAVAAAGAVLALRSPSWVAVAVLAPTASFFLASQAADALASVPGPVLLVGFLVPWPAALAGLVGGLVTGPDSRRTRAGERMTRS